MSSVKEMFLNVTSFDPMPLFLYCISSITKGKLIVLLLGKLRLVNFLQSHFLSWALLFPLQEIGIKHVF